MVIKIYINILFKNGKIEEEFLNYNQRPLSILMFSRRLFLVYIKRLSFEIFVCFVV